MRQLFFVLALSGVIAGGAMLMSAPAQAQPGTICCGVPFGGFQRLTPTQCTQQGGQPRPDNLCPPPPPTPPGGGVRPPRGHDVGDVSLICCRRVSGPASTDPRVPPRFNTSFSSAADCTRDLGAQVSRSECSVATDSREHLPVCCAQSNCTARVATRAECNRARGWVMSVGADECPDYVNVRDHRGGMTPDPDSCTVCCRADFAPWWSVPERILNFYETRLITVRECRAAADSSVVPLSQCAGGR